MIITHIFFFIIIIVRQAAGVQWMLNINFILKLIFRVPNIDFIPGSADLLFTLIVFFLQMLFVKVSRRFM